MGVEMTQTNSNIWNAMLDAEYNVKVIDRLGKKYYKYDMYSKILLVIMTLSSFLILVIWGYYPVFLKSLTALSAIIAIVIPIINLPKSMQILIERANKWGGLSFKYNRLWENRYNEDDLQVKYDQIKNEEYIEKEEVVFHLSLSMKEKEECQNEVLKSRELEG